MESVDTADSKSVLRKGVGVQVPPHALLSSVFNRVHIYNGSVQVSTGGTDSG